MHTPGPWKWVDSPGAGLQIHGVLPAGLKFDATYCDADGNTSFMLYTLRESVMVGIGDARWVQFETSQWAEMQKANAILMATSPELLEALEDIIDCDTYTEAQRKNAKTVIAKARGHK